jgi:hypothetical protein
MRVLLLPLLLLFTASCREAAQGNAAEPAGTDALDAYAGAGRDRLCLAPNGGTAGLITFAATGDSNCSIRGTFGGAQDARIKPNGDEACAVPVRVEGARVTLGQPSAACAYYCGPGASLAGKTFDRMDNPAQVTDLGGDPLC